MLPDSIITTIFNLYCIYNEMFAVFLYFTNINDICLIANLQECYNLKCTVSLRALSEKCNWVALCVYLLVGFCPCIFGVFKSATIHKTDGPA